MMTCSTGLLKSWRILLTRDSFRNKLREVGNELSATALNQSTILLARGQVPCYHKASFSNAEKSRCAMAALRTYPPNFEGNGTWAQQDWEPRSRIARAQLQ